MLNLTLACLPQAGIGKLGTRSKGGTDDNYAAEEKKGVF
jgi:hypothetical protein